MDTAGVLIDTALFSIHQQSNLVLAIPILDFLHTHCPSGYLEPTCPPLSNTFLGSTSDALESFSNLPSFLCIIPLELGPHVGEALIRLLFVEK